MYYLLSLKWRIAQSLEWRWWKNYLKKKDKPAYLHWKQQYWQQFLQQLSDVLPLTPNDRVLDAGCGPAGIFTALPLQEVVAVDPLLEQYLAQLTHFNPAEYPNVQFITATLEAYRPAQTFNTVFCLNAINHVANIKQCMDTLYAVTQPKGYLVLSIDAHNHTWLKHIFRLLPADALHPQQHTLAEYLQMLTERKFTPLKMLQLKKGFIFGYWVIVAQKTE